MHAGVAEPRCNSLETRLITPLMRVCQKEWRRSSESAAFRSTRLTSRAWGRFFHNNGTLPTACAASARAATGGGRASTIQTLHTQARRRAWRALPHPPTPTLPGRHRPPVFAQVPCSGSRLLLGPPMAGPRAFECPRTGCNDL